MWSPPANSALEDLKKLFSPFTDSNKIINLFRESQAAYNSILNYENHPEGEDLIICQTHIKKILMNQADFLAGIYRAKSSSIRLDRNLLLEIVNNNNNFINSELSTTEQKISTDMTGENLDLMRNLIQNYLSFFTEKYFPHDTWLKCGYISYALMQLYDEISYETASKFQYSDEEKGKKAEEIFREEFVKSSLTTLSGPSYDDLISACRKKYGAQDEQSPNWYEDDLTQLLTKIDFNIKGFTKALVRVCGACICVATAAGKIASVITINPVLNGICIKGFIMGAGIAIAPSSAAKLAQKVGF